MSTGKEGMQMVGAVGAAGGIGEVSEKVPVGGIGGIGGGGLSLLQRHAQETQVTLRWSDLEYSMLVKDAAKPSYCGVCPSYRRLLCAICVLYVCYMCVICVLYVCYMCVICVLYVTLTLCPSYLHYRRKRILHGLSGEACSGQLLAIMGPTGVCVCMYVCVFGVYVCMCLCVCVCVFMCVCVCVCMCMCMCVCVCMCMCMCVYVCVCMGQLLAIMGPTGETAAVDHSKACGCMSPTLCALGRI
jgi:hypothetical protein